MRLTMKIQKQKYLLPDGREVTIKSAGPEDVLIDEIIMANIFD